MINHDILGSLENPNVAISIIAIAAVYGWYLRVRRRALTVHDKTSQQSHAQNPTIDRQWLSKSPTGLIVGKATDGRYYCLPEEIRGTGYAVNHALIIGGSGTGKTSSVYAESILQAFTDKKFCFLACDIKGELHKCFCPPVIAPESDKDDSNPYYLLDPVDRDLSYGFDPFGAMGDLNALTNDEITQISSDIASAYVSVSGEKDKYFSANALTMLSGFVAASLETRTDYVDLMRRLLSENVKTLMAEYYNSTMPGSVTRFYLGRFQGKGKDNESLDDIISTMTTALTPFALDSVCYMLRDNPYKISVRDIRKKSIVLSVPDDMLDENTFAPVYRMILVLMQRYLIKRIPDPGTKPVVLFYDEFFSLGGSENGSGIPGIQHFMSISRQYGCACVAAIQSEKMLVKQYGREGAKILEDNMVKVILQINDPDTIKSAISWTGTFQERSISTQDDRSLKSTISWHLQDIFDGADFSSLAGRKRVIVIPLTDSFAQIVKSQWFTEPYFVRLQKHITSTK